MNSRAMASKTMDQRDEHEFDGKKSSLQYVPGILVSLTVIILLTVVGMKLIDPTTLPIRQVSVTGEFLNLSPIGLQERVSNAVRGSFFNVNVEEIQNLLLDEPWVKEVSVNRVWPDKITVTIKEQKAVAQWGDQGLLNSEAVLFVPDKDTFPDGLPILSGPGNTAGLVLGNIEKLRTILPDGLDITQLALSDRRSWTLKMNNGLDIRLGKTGVIEKTYQFFEYFPMAEMNELEMIMYVDMRYTNGFIVKWNPELNSELQNRLETNGEEI